MPGRENGKCINHSEAGRYLLHSKNRKEARVAEAGYGREEIGNEVIGNRMLNCVGT